MSLPSTKRDPLGLGAFEQTSSDIGSSAGTLNTSSRVPPPAYLLPRRVAICRSGVKYIASGEFHAFAVDTKDKAWSLYTVQLR